MAEMEGFCLRAPKILKSGLGLIGEAEYQEGKDRDCA
jgi:hypothetical protein